MSSELNQKDIALLHTNHEQLILGLQGLIDIVINQYINSGKFKYHERQEIKQIINVELIVKIKKIQDQYQEKSLLRTYLCVVIRNICNELLRKKKNTEYLSLDESVIVEESIGNINTLIVEEEMIRFKNILELYYKQKNKLILCLKLKFKMTVKIEDFQTINKNITQPEFEKFNDSIFPYEDCSETKIFIALNLLFNKYEEKKNTPDSLRKWVSDKINELIDILNGSPPASKYDKETLQILFEKCYYEEQKIKFGSTLLKA